MSEPQIEVNVVTDEAYAEFIRIRNAAMEASIRGELGQ